MIRIPDPDLQIDFALALARIRTLSLQDALRAAISNLHVPAIDKELAEYVPASSLGLLAAHGLRGELIFPVPLVIGASPRLIGYYRLLYGFSQKEFYGSASGVGPFKALEERGALTELRRNQLPGLCHAMCRAGMVLVAGIRQSDLNARLLDDLTLLTLGPQLRGGANVRRGIAGVRAVFNVIHNIVRHAAVSVDETRIEIANAAGRTVLIEFAPDPDIVIREEMRPDNFRQIIAIEIKSGVDFSNVHNRIGEAEKSHQKARARGFMECWTVVNVDSVDLAMAHRESPTTTRFYRLSDLLAAGGEYQDFADRITSLTGVPTKRRPPSS